MSLPATRAAAVDIATAAAPVDALDWAGLAAALDEWGFATTGRLLDKETCHALRECYDDDGLFRSHIVMARHGFGRGEYKYFTYPLPELIARLRDRLYAHLAPVANRWLEMSGREDRFPDDHATFLARCHAAGQSLPTPLLLRYGKDDYNCLHQDLYGAHVFPLQVAVLLSAPVAEFEGGEFVLTEQRPRMQSRVGVVPLDIGEAVIFAVNERPVTGKRGVYRVRMRHGVSRVRAGQRHVLGIIFHDAA